MKKLFVIAAAACVTFASCVKNEPVATVEQGEAIAFDAPVVAPNVKSIAGRTGFTQGTDDFKVWAYLTAAKMNETLAVNNVYINGETVSYTSAAWQTANAYYWPKDGYLTFVGVSPAATDNTSVTADGLQISSYEVDPAAQEDLLVSDILFDLDNGQPVPLAFYHALSALKFNVATDITGLTVVLKSITLSDVESTGVFSQGGSGFKSTNKCWSDPDSPETYTAFVGTQTVSVGSTPTTKNDEFNLILLPQPIDDIQLTVVYSIKGADMAEAVDQTVTVGLKQGDDDEWFRGTCYTYNLTLHLDKITFVPSVQPWAEETVLKPDTI